MPALQIEILENPKTEVELVEQTLLRYKSENRKYLYIMSASRGFKDSIYSMVNKEITKYIFEAKKCPRGLWDIIIEIL